MNYNMPRTTHELTCVLCSEKFTGYVGWKYCKLCKDKPLPRNMRNGDKQRRAPWAKPVKVEKPCAQCGTPFLGFETYKYCSKKCRRAASIAANIAKVPQDVCCPRGYYVYAWYAEGEQLPRYVGKGKADRGFRENEYNVRVEVIRDNLTEEGAYLIESALLSVFKRLGACALNKDCGRIDAFYEGPFELEMK